MLTFIMSDLHLNTRQLSEKKTDNLLYNAFSRRDNSWTALTSLHLPGLAVTPHK